jgi:hypothetical protein
MLSGKDSIIVMVVVIIVLGGIGLVTNPSTTGYSLFSFLRGTNKATPVVIKQLPSTTQNANQFKQLEGDIKNSPTSRCDTFFGMTSTGPNWIACPKDSGGTNTGSAALDCCAKDATCSSTVHWAMGRDVPAVCCPKSTVAMSDGARNFCAVTKIFCEERYPGERRKPCDTQCCDANERCTGTSGFFTKNNQCLKRSCGPDETLCEKYFWGLGGALCCKKNEQCTRTVTAAAQCIPTYCAGTETLCQGLKNTIFEKTAVCCTKASTCAYGPGGDPYCG